MIFTASSLYAQNLISNGDFQNWGTLTDDPNSGLKKGVPTDWLVEKGNGELVTYQSTETPDDNGYSVFLCNTSPNASRFISPSTSTLSTGMYKLSFQTKGKVTWKNITLTEENIEPKGSTATTQADDNRFPVTGQFTDVIPEDTDWYTVELSFNVLQEGKYKLIFWPTKTAAANADNFLLVTDIVLTPLVDNTIATLETITVGGKSINYFDASKTTYNILMNTAIPQIVGVPTDENAVVQLSEPVVEDNITTYELLVTAADGITTKTYTLNFEITNDLVVQGFTSDVLPSGWTSSKTGSNNDWLIDQNANWNNGLYMGAYSLRARGGGDPSITELWLMIPNLNMPGVLSFYLKEREQNTSSTLSIYKREANANPFDGLSGWTLTKTFDSPNDNVFTEKNVVINSKNNIDLLFYLEKENGKIPFEIDDIRITKYDFSTFATQIGEQKVQIFSSNGQLILNAFEPISYLVRSLSGILLYYGSDKYVSLQLQQGIYLVEINGENHKIIIP